jgi:hypothetical protein
VQTPVVFATKSVRVGGLGRCSFTIADYQLVTVNGTVTQTY